MERFITYCNDTIHVLVANLGGEDSPHAGASATTKGVRDLEALEAVGGLCLRAHNVEHRVNELSTLGSVVALGPVVAGTGLAEDEVVRAKDLAIRTSANRVHGTRLEIHEDSTGNVLTTGGLWIIQSRISGRKAIAS